MTIPSTMALAAKLLICLAFFFGGVYCRGIRQSSSGAGTAPQTCPNGYYCPSDGQCKSPRNDRCTSSQDCTGLDDCEKQADGYRIRIGHTRLTSFSSSSKQYRLEHQFVVYRGFAYEFGGSYNTQILDISDPQYKYLNDRNVRYTNDGTSYCTYNEAVLFVNDWARRYNVITNNCQHFAIALSAYLQSPSCGQQGAQDLKQNTGDTDMLMEEIDDILSNCTLVCCNDPTGSSGGSTLISSIPVVAFAFIYTFFVIFI